MKVKILLKGLLSIFPALYCFCLINELTLSTRMQQILVFAYLEVLFVIVLWLLEKKLLPKVKSLRPWLFMAGISFLFTLIFVQDFMPKHFEKNVLEIRNVQETNLQSKGSEIWISRISVNGDTVDLQTLASADNGWIYKDGGVYTTKESYIEPIRVEIYKKSTIELQLAKHEWAGIAEITFQGNQQQIDLYETEQIPESVVFQSQGIQYDGATGIALVIGFFMLCFIVSGIAFCILLQMKPGFPEKYFCLLSVLIIGLALPMRVPTIVIEPLNEKSENSQGTEIWILGIDGTTPAKMENLQLPEGWIQSGENIVYVGTSKEPLYLTLSNKNPEIQFGKHGWSGMVKIRYGVAAKQIDLYSSNGGYYEYSPTGVISLRGGLITGILTLILLSVGSIKNTWKTQTANAGYIDILKYLLVYVWVYILGICCFYVSDIVYFLTLLCVLILSCGLLLENSNWKNILIYLLPVVLFLSIEAISNGNAELLTWRAVCINILMLALITAFFVNLFSYKNIGVLMITVLAFIFSTANYFVIQFKKYAMIPADVLQIGTAKAVAGNYEYHLDDSILLGIFLLLSFIYLIFSQKIKHKESKRPWWRKKALAVAAAAGVIVIIKVVNFESINTTSEEWDNNWNNTNYYSQNGFVASFIKYWQDMDIKAPEGYSKEYAENLLDKYSVRQANEEITDEKPVIITIMNESLSDLSDWIEMGESDEGLSYYKSLQNFLEKGDAYVSVLGGGTCNSEFEFLTGNSMDVFEAVYPYTMFNFEKVESMVSTLKTQGYRAIAMHPANPGNYKRSSVYTALGFDKFYSYDDYEDAEKLFHDQISDRGDYEKILEVIDSTEEPVFIFNVTIQNHGPYTIEDLSDGVSLADLDDSLGSYDDLRMFLTLMKESDKALEYLIDELEKRDRKIVLCMFGDHQPGALNENLNNFFIDDIDGNSQNRYKTPYLIWANYDIGIQKAEREFVSSPNFMASSILQYAGLQKTAYQMFIYEMHKDILASNKSGYMGANGIWYSYDETSPYEHWIKDYRILQYYNMFESP